MSEDLFDTMTELKTREDHAYLTADRTTVYVLHPSGEGLLAFYGDFSNMNETEINDYIVAQLS